MQKKVAISSSEKRIEKNEMLIFNHRLLGHHDVEKASLQISRRISNEPIARGLGENVKVKSLKHMQTRYFQEMSDPKIKASSKKTDKLFQSL